MKTKVTLNKALPSQKYQKILKQQENDVIKIKVTPRLRFRQKRRNKNNNKKR